MSDRPNQPTLDPSLPGSDDDELRPRLHAITAPFEDERHPTHEMPVLDPEVGDRIDRYVILRKLGSTRHSDIYAAHDPELDRKVALKLLSLDVVDEEDGYRRLMAEAQATARLAHPNMVKVHDVGTWHGRPFIAREFIEGASVHTWKRRRNPSRAEVLRVMLLAGRGLAALHSAGLVHRDINLHAILVGEDGSVRVTDMDFVGSVESLALPSATDGDTLDSREISGSVELADDSSDSVRRSSDSASFREDSSSFVRAAGLSGVFEDSPYASPEQLLGRVADARSDQFMFCVALYEALFSRPPFGSGTGARRLARIEAGRVRVPRGRYSRRTYNAIKRGLSADALDRFPNMDALLKAAAPATTRWALGLPAVGAMAVVAGVSLMSPEEPTTYCAAVDNRLEGVWDEDRARTMSEAFRRSGLAYADDLFGFTQRQLDAWADEWVTRYAELCGISPEDGAAGAVAREMHCLSLRREELASVVDTLTTADERSIENASKIVRDLGTVKSCSDPDQWLGPREKADEATALNRGLAQLEAYKDSNRIDEALPLAESLLDQARALGHGPSLVRAMHARAQLLAMARNPDAESALHEALSEALAQGQYTTVANVATALANLLGRKREFEEAERWLDHAEAALARGTDANSPGYAGIESARGQLARLQGSFEAALRHHKKALELRIEVLGTGDDRIGSYLVNVGQAYQDLGRFAEARTHYEQAIHSMAKSLGADHPHLAAAHMALCSTLSQQGEFETGLVHGKRAMRILEQAYGKTRSLLADAMLSAAMAHSGMGEHAESIALQEEAIEIYRATEGDRSFRVALALNNLGVENHAAGNFDKALAYYAESHARAVETVGADHIETAHLLTSRVSVLLTLGRYEEADHALTQAMNIIEPKVDDKHPMLGFPLGFRGEILAIKGELQPALDTLHRAIDINVATGGRRAEVGRLRLLEATILEAMGRGEEAGRLRSSTEATLRALGSGGAVALRDAGIFAEQFKAHQG